MDSASSLVNHYVNRRQERLRKNKQGDSPFYNTLDEQPKPKLLTEQIAERIIKIYNPLITPVNPKGYHTGRKKWFEWSLFYRRVFYDILF